MPKILSPVPYDSILGLDDSKLAIMCLAVDPSIKGLIIRGPSGVGKTALIRALSGIVFEGNAIAVPMNTTDDHMFGSLDIESAITTGQVNFTKGLMGDADGGVLVIDDINLFDRKFVHGLMGSVVENKVMVEREGISREYDTHVSIIATINSREPELSSGISDLFEMRVNIIEPEDKKFKAEVMREALVEREDTFDPEPIRRKIDAAKELLPKVKMSDEMFDAIIDVCTRYAVQGHRGEIAAVRVAKAIAALDGRTEVTRSDTLKACVFCLDHRRNRTKKLVKDGDRQSVNMFMQQSLVNILKRTEKAKKDQEVVVEEDSEAGPSTDVAYDVALDGGDAVVETEVSIEVGEMFDTIDLVEDSRKKLNVMDVKQERKAMKSAGRDGRYVSSRPKSENSNDIAIDATIRKAAPYQKVRRKDGEEGVVIKNYDLMEKVREKRVSCMFLFMIDNSGSLVISRRMTSVKAAVLSMIMDHFLRRDSVAIGVFNEKSVGLVMPPTHSTSSVKNVLSEITVGMKTPLGDALVFSDGYVKEYLRKHPYDTCYVIMMTDALANLPIMEGADPIEESLAIARKVTHERVNWIVVNTASKRADQTICENFAKALCAPYYLLEDLKSSDPEGQLWAMTKISNR